MKTARFALLLILWICGEVKGQQLVLRGDYPDPSIIKVGDTYWSSATTSNWAPVYPLLHSKDMVKWETSSYVFPELPDWADYYFWAPELNYDNGKFYVYYSAHKKDGNLCVAIASADKPEGPYKDHGPLICQEVGSIDAFPVRDESGKLHIVWKEDANSVGKPTPIWISELSEDRTKLIGEKKELFRNDIDWEANLVEGVSMIRNGDYYYAFYAAAGCCGAACTYGVGVARSKKLMGPWEKYAKNPVMAHSERWKCPGHGTPVEKDGRYYFMYHAYDAKENIYTGRQGLLMEFRFTNDRWVEFIKTDDAAANTKPAASLNDFSKADLGPDWQWSVFQKPSFNISGGRLQLNASDSAAGAMLGHKILSADYTATVKIVEAQQGVSAGLAVIGDEQNLIAALVSGKMVNVVHRKNGKDSLIASTRVRGGQTYLRVTSSSGKALQFLCSGDGKRYTVINKVQADASNLPPWDRALRVGLLARGRSGTSVFDDFNITYP